MDERTKNPEGRFLYMSKCNSCHKLYDPKQFSIMEWDSIITIMKQKAKISSEQRELIHSWILEKKYTATDSILQ